MEIVRIPTSYALYQRVLRQSNEVWPDSRLPVLGQKPISSLMVGDVPLTAPLFIPLSACEEGSRDILHKASILTEKVMSDDEVLSLVGDDHFEEVMAVTRAFAQGISYWQGKEENTEVRNDAALFCFNLERLILGCLLKGNGRQEALASVLAIARGGTPLSAFAVALASAASMVNPSEELSAVTRRRQVDREFYETFTEYLDKKVSYTLSQVEQKIRDKKYPMGFIDRIRVVTQTHLASLKEPSMVVAGDILSRVHSGDLTLLTAKNEFSGRLTEMFEASIVSLDFIGQVKGVLVEAVSCLGSDIPTLKAWVKDLVYQPFAFEEADFSRELVRAVKSGMNSRARTILEKRFEGNESALIAMGRILTQLSTEFLIIAQKCGISSEVSDFHQWRIKEKRKFAAQADAADNEGLASLRDSFLSTMKSTVNRADSMEGLPEWRSLLFPLIEGLLGRAASPLLPDMVWRYVDQFMTANAGLLDQCIITNPEVMDWVAKVDQVRATPRDTAN